MSQYFQIPSTRDVQGSNFASSQIVFPYMLDSGSWSPSKSYFRMRVELRNQVGNPIGFVNDIAPNMDMFSNMFVNIKFLINGVCVEEISDYVPQICSLKQRLYQSKSWLDGQGAGLNWYQHDQRERLRLVASDGIPSGGVASQTTVPMTRVQMGFTAASTVAIDANGLVTFSSNVALGAGDLPNPFPYKEGDYYIDTNTDDEDMRVVTKILTNIGTSATMQTTLKTFGNLTTANAGPLRDFFRLPGTYIPTYRRSAIELIAKLPLGSWDEKVMKSYPPGVYTVIMTPHQPNNVYNMAIESISRNKSQISNDANIGFRIHVIDMFLYAYQMDHNPHEGKSQLDVEFVNTKCQAEDVTSGGGLMQKSFSTMTPVAGITIAFQDQSYGNDTRRSATKFKIRPEPPIEDLALTLTRLYVNYNNIKKPSNESDPDFTTPKNYFTQRYYESAANIGNIEHGESLSDWIERGPYYHWNWDSTPNDGGEGDTKAFVYYSFSSNLQNKANILFFHHYHDSFTLQLQDGKVTQTFA